MLSPNALRVLDSLGVFQKVRANSYEFDRFIFKNVEGETTDVYYFGSKEQYGYPALRVERKLLLDTLTAMVTERGVEIAYSQGFTRVISESSTDQSVTFELDDGTVRTSSLLVGADGIHSEVRKYIFPDCAPIYSGFTAINCTVPRSALRIPKDYELPATVLGPPGAFLLVPQKPGGTELLIGSQMRMQERTRQGWTALRTNKQGLLDTLNNTKDQWPDIVQSALEAAPVENMGIWPFYTIPALPHWASEASLVVLLGDAAHAVPPTAGQGVNQAFEDAATLAALLVKLSRETTLNKALRWWQSYRQARVDKVLELTRQMNAKRLPASEKAKLPKNMIWSDEGATRGDGRQLAWLYTPDLLQVVDAWISGDK
ncbi:kynurenine 3-monooxygenase [Periconia macrospinosa]|uniref:Kynurenine 3-monooxygenase n=1 Tax=Periconia macrospinosa TaxID=97972 RepID=A0A2V1DQX4_9PLEO|nr:kynurenine 3-monooxygenase [Periconia macrospinosa]